MIEAERRRTKLFAHTHAARTLDIERPGYAHPLRVPPGNHSAAASFISPGTKAGKATNPDLLSAPLASSHFDDNPSSSTIYYAALSPRLHTRASTIRFRPFPPSIKTDKEWSQAIESGKCENEQKTDRGQIDKKGG